MIQIDRLKDRKNSEEEKENIRHKKHKMIPMGQMEIIAKREKGGTG